MIEEKSFKGLWSLPGSETKLTGFLTFDQTNGPRLELVGSFHNYWDQKPIELLWGETTDGWVTLCDVYYDSGASSNVTKTTTTVYQPYKIFVGHRFDTLDDIKFTSVIFHVFNLLEWLDLNGIKEDRKYPDYQLDYKQPETVVFKCYEGCDGKIEFDLKARYPNQYYKINFEQSCKVTFNYATQRKYNEILLDISKFVGFVTLGTYEQSYPKKIDFFDDSIFDSFIQGHLNKKVPQAVECFFQTSHFSLDYKLRKWPQHLILYKKIEKQFPLIIQQWFNKYEELNQVMNLMLRYFLDKYNFNTEKFMDSVRALEIFHRRNLPNQAMPESEYEVLKSKFTSVPGLTKKEKKWIAGKLKHANEPFLAQRLGDLVKKYSFPYFTQRVPKPSDFCQQAADSRNYYTHFDRSLASKSLTGVELFEMTENLRLLLFSAVFSTLGISSDAFDDSIRRVVH